MGMYDYVKCRHKLPSDTPPGLGKDVLFQTKSLSRQMFTYTIHEDGSLGVDDERQQKYADNYSGEIVFYHAVPYRFVALYARGQLLDIVCLGDDEQEVRL